MNSQSEKGTGTNNSVKMLLFCVALQINKGHLRPFQFNQFKPIQFWAECNFSPVHQNWTSPLPPLSKHFSAPFYHEMIKLIKLEDRMEVVKMQSGKG
jgi:hypothetical protein